MSSKLAMPILLVNLGGEMMYVLNQRLTAQKIDPNKAQQVLNEIIGAMFNTDFLDALFKPHDLYSFQATKKLFEKLAHCSIMKLNETSMSKLYDLMTMVFKYQLVNCRSPRDVIEVTNRHLGELAKLVNDEDVGDLLEACRKRIKSCYGSLSIGQLWALKQTLMDFCQGRHVKISLLLKENFQAQDGRIFINLDGPCPAETPVPGSVRHFDAEASVIDEYRADLGVLKDANVYEYSPEAAEEAHKLLGANLYAIFRGSSESQQQQDESKSEDTDNHTEGKEEERANEALDRLADLIVPRSSSAGSSSKIRLNLFDTACDPFGFGTGHGKSYPHDEDAHGSKETDDDLRSHVYIESKSNRGKSMRERLQDLNFDVENGASKVCDDDEDDDDLLDLMDRATEQEQEAQRARSYK